VSAPSSLNELSFTERLVSLRNGLDFWLRQQVKHRWLLPKQAFTEVPGQTDSWFRPQWEQAREAEAWQAERLRLLSTYGLMGRFQQLTPLRQCETLCTLLALEALWPEPSFGLHTHWLDVGCKNLAYIEALVAFWRHHQPHPQATLTLLGVELDAYRRYQDGYCRCDYAEHYVAKAQQAWPGLTARYQAGSVEGVEASFEVVTWFLPFVVPDPLLAWGLPVTAFQPELLLNHVLQRLAPGGCLLLSHLNLEEADVQRVLFQQVGARKAFQIQDVEPWWPVFLPATEPRAGFRCRRP
jgi:SAM-dependent methyltransferase